MGWYEERRTKECIEGLQKVIDALDEKDRIINSLRKENKKLEDEHYKDKELKNCKKKLKSCRATVLEDFQLLLKNKKR